MARELAIHDSALREYIKTYKTLFKGCGVRIIGSGSTAEGLACPFISTAECCESDVNIYSTDYDLMLALSCDFTIQDGREHLHPGYVHLVMTDPHQHADIFKHLDDSSGSVFIKTTPFVDRLHAKGPGLIYDSHGPASRITWKWVMGDFSFCEEIDRVYCLTYPRWPGQASEWIHRQRLKLNSKRKSSIFEIKKIYNSLNPAVLSLCSVDVNKREPQSLPELYSLTARNHPCRLHT